MGGQNKTILPCTVIVGELNAKINLEQNLLFTPFDFICCELLILLQVVIFIRFFSMMYWCSDRSYHCSGYS